jgi:hypothetical protein
MVNKIKVLTLNGYSRTGKSTVTQELVKQGWVKSSTTDYLTIATIQHYGLEPNELTINDFTSKESDDYYILRFGKNTREMKIHVAEEVLVPKYGRYRGLVVPTVDLAMDELFLVKRRKEHKLLIETVNLGEYEMFVTCLAGKQAQDFRFEFLEPIYLDRSTALKGVDLRNPFGKAIDNNGSIERTMAAILQHVG